MKTYTEPQFEMISQLPTEFCAVTEIISDNEVENRIIMSLEDALK